MTKKKIILCVTLITLSIFSIFAFKSFQKYQKQYTGKQWYERQSDYIDDLSVYTGEMDDIFSLYIAESISEDDFLNHVSLLQNQLSVIQVSYQQEKENHPVRTGSYTYNQKYACEGVEETLTHLQEILDMARENSGDVTTLAYKYLALHQNIIDSMSKYTAAQTAIAAGNP